MPPVLAAVLLLFLSVTLWSCGKDSTPGPASRPSTAQATTLSTTQAPDSVNASACLCIFDIDRTLTGKQGKSAECPQDEVQPNVSDTAYGGGTLTLSMLAQALVSTDCAKCYIGAISAGIASGPHSRERQILHKKLAVVPGKLPTDQWSWPVRVTSPLVVGCPDRTKQNAVPGILAWYREAGVGIRPSDVYFYDDRPDNVEAFRGHPYNAKQVSCATRDAKSGGLLGLCGATVAEIKLEKGVRTCNESTVAPGTSAIFKKEA